MLKTRDMQANPCHVKIVVLLKKINVVTGRILTKERKTETENGILKKSSQEVGVGFKHVEKVVNVRVKRTSAALGLTRLDQNPIFIHLHTLKLHYRRRMGDSIWQNKDLHRLVTDVKEH